MSNGPNTIKLYFLLHLMSMFLSKRGAACCIGGQPRKLQLLLFKNLEDYEATSVIQGQGLHLYLVHTSEMAAMTLAANTHESKDWTWDLCCRKMQFLCD